MSQVACADLPDHIAYECPDYKTSRNNAIAVLNEDHTITDFTSAAQWNTAITAGDAKLLKKIAAQYDEPSEILVENPEDCSADQILIGFDHVLSWQDGQVSSFNQSFYEQLNKFKGYIVWYNCEEEEIFVMDTARASIVAKPAWGARGEILKYTARAEWREKRDVFYEIYDAPANIFT